MVSLDNDEESSLFCLSTRFFLTFYFSLKDSFQAKSRPESFLGCHFENSKARNGMYRGIALCLNFYDFILTLVYNHNRRILKKLDKRTLLQLNKRKISI